MREWDRWSFIVFLNLMACEWAFCVHLYERMFVYVLCASVCACLLVSPMSGFTSLSKGIFSVCSHRAPRSELLSVRSMHAKRRIKCPWFDCNAEFRMECKQNKPAQAFFISSDRGLVRCLQICLSLKMINLTCFTVWTEFSFLTSTEMLSSWL